MATRGCQCCGCEIRADAAFCYTCQGRPPLPEGTVVVEQPLTPWERDQAFQRDCPHRSIYDA